MGRQTRAHAVLLAAGIVVALSLVSFAPAQTQAPATPQPAPPATQPPASGSGPGFLDAVGRLFGQSKEAIDSQFKSTHDTLGNLGSQATGAAKDAANAANQAAGSVIALPGTRIVTGKQLCPAAANGAPDCQQGAAALCREKGFPSGRHLEIATSQRCSIRSWIASKGKEGDCRVENYVTRAICQ
jgi:hypothetical protein